MSGAFTSSSLTMRIPSRAYLLGAIIVFATANSITRQLSNIGERNLIDARNPISLCNVLFVGNLCALIALIVLYRKQWNIQSLKQLSRTSCQRGGRKSAAGVSGRACSISNGGMWTPSEGVIPIGTCKTSGGVFFPVLGVGFSQSARLVRAARLNNPNRCPRPPFFIKIRIRGHFRLEFFP
jgi:hypothetical protein